MAVGPGKYNDHVTRVREELDADLVLLIVLGGKRGNGFDVQSTSIELQGQVPELLEHMAREIRASLAARNN